MDKKKVFIAGITKENPVLMMFLGMCPALAITTSIDNGIGMGLAVIIVLLLTNSIISLIRNTVPNEIRIPVYIIIIAAVVSIIEMLMQAYTPQLSTSLGIFIPLIVVNCIILGRAEAFASKNNILNSMIDALGMGLGFTLGIFLMSFVRQLLGTGVLNLHNMFDSSVVFFQFNIIPKDFVIDIFTQPTGAFLTLGFLVAIVNAITSAVKKHQANKKVEAK
ncbi:TPA: electron transport complex subunit RsxE [bacterium]|nr:electron transport complex subunit RsxE [bacterium]